MNHRKSSGPLFCSQRRKPEQSLADRQMRVFADIHICGNQKAILPPIAKHDAEKRTGEAAGQIGSLAGSHDLMRRKFASEPIANRFPQLMRIRGSILCCIFPCYLKCFRYRAPGTGEEQAQTPWFWLRGGNPETRPTPLPPKTKADLIPLYPPPRIHSTPGSQILGPPSDARGISLALFSANSNSARFLCKYAATSLFTIASPSKCVVSARQLCISLFFDKSAAAGKWRSRRLKE